jgi:hypothetical protein
MVECSKTEIINGSEVREPTQTMVAPAPDSVEPIGHSSRMPFREFWPIYRKAVSKNPLRNRELSDYLAAQPPQTICLISDSLEYFLLAARCLLRASILLMVAAAIVFRVYGSPYNLRVVYDVLFYAICFPGIDQQGRSWLLRRATKVYLAVNESRDAHQLELCARAFAVTPERDRDLMREWIVVALQTQTDEQIERISVDAKRALAKLVEGQWFQKNVSVAILHRWRPLASAELLDVVRRVAAKQNTRHPIVAAATLCLPDLETLVGRREQEQQLLRGAATHTSLDHLRATESPGGTQDQQELLRANSHHRA